MAVKLKKGSKNYQIVSQYKGTTYDYSSGTPNKAVAEDMEKEHLADLHKSYGQGKARRITLADACALYLDYRDDDLKWTRASANSGQNFARALLGTKRHQGKNAHNLPPVPVHALSITYVDELTLQRAKDHIRARRNEGLTDQTIKHEINFLKKVVRHFRDDPKAYITAPDFKWPTLKGAPRRERILTDEEIQELRDALVGQPDHLDYFNVLCYMGLRAREADKLTFNDIDWHNMTIEINRFKTGDTSILDLTPEICEIFHRRYNDPDRHHTWIFTDDKGTSHRTDARSWWKGAIAKTSINDANKLDKHQYPQNHAEKGTPHHLRHRFATKLAMSGMFTIEEIGHFMNHSDPRSTARYIKFMPRSVSKKVAAMSRALK